MNALLYIPSASLLVLGPVCLALDWHLLCWLLMALAVAWMPGYCFLVWLWQPALMAWVNAPDAAHAPDAPDRAPIPTEGATR